MAVNESVGISISQDLIKDVVHQKILESIAGDHKAMIDAVVKEALDGDKWNHRDTPFKKACREMVTEVAKDVFKEWLVEQKAAIKDAMVAAMNKGRAKKIRDLVDTMTDSLEKVYIKDLTVKLDEGRGY